RLDEDRIIRVSAVVAQQLRRTVEVSNDQIHVSIIIDVAKRNPATRVRRGQNVAKLRRNFSERPVAIVVVQQTRLAIVRQLRINVPVRDKQIYPTIVVVVEKLRAPTDPRQT